MRCKSQGYERPSGLRTTEKLARAVGLAVAPSHETDVWEMTDARSTSGACFALSIVWMCSDAITSGGEGGGSASGERHFLPPGSVSSNLHHVDDESAGAAPSSLSQQGPMMRRLSKSSSSAEVDVPKMREKYVPDASQGSAGNSAE